MKILAHCQGCGRTTRFERPRDSIFVDCPYCKEEIFIYEVDSDYTESRKGFSARIDEQQTRLTTEVTK